ncbi:DUF488 family protein [Roseococcus sp. YIM B11640]|uniref:DUF488 domain-containing protein n=1 Tax=Roseococcus sp. YIM B11640 TaxID=3133973 RepID=UPI003C799A2B
MTVALATIGFTRTTAERFFERLGGAQVKRVIDVRLHNTSQLAGFAKSDDLAWFLRTINGTGYVHAPELAPTEELMKFFKTDKGDWKVFERGFRALMKERRIERELKPSFFAGGCLLCSEPTAERCHRRLVVDYLNEHWGGELKVTHL